MRHRDDGSPLARIDGALDVRKPHRLWITGDSYTRILVSPVDMWRGVRTNIDWSALDTTRATGKR